MRLAHMHVLLFNERFPSPRRFPKPPSDIQLGVQVPVRCIWRIVLPLQEMGYQVDIRLMNAVHYAVPQRREVGAVADKEPQHCLMRSRCCHGLRVFSWIWPLASEK